MSFKHIFIFSVIMLFKISSFGQETDRYKELTQNFKLLGADSLSPNKNKIGLRISKQYEATPRIPHSVSTWRFFDIQVGERREYYWSGKLKSYTRYNNFGKKLQIKRYTRDGNLKESIKTTLLDSSAKNIIEFFSSNEFLTLLQIHKEFKYSSKLNEMYLRKEGKIKNGKKIGEWDIYKPDGSLKRNKNYN